MDSIKVVKRKTPFPIDIPVFGHSMPTIECAPAVGGHFVVTGVRESGDAVILQINPHRTAEFIYKDKPLVDSFIKKHKKLRRLLPELRSKVTECFGEDSPISFMVVD